MKKTNLPKLSIYDIKRLSSEKSPYFFTRDTMKFFHQTMRDFRVCRMFESGSAPIRDSGRIVGQTVRYFNPLTNELQLTK